MISQNKDTNSLAPLKLTGAGILIPSPPRGRGSKNAIPTSASLGERGIIFPGNRLKFSGTLSSSRFLLSNLGIDVDRDFDLVFYINFDQNTRAPLHGYTQALSLEAGVPASAITLVKTFAGPEVVILDFTDAQLERADGGLGLWVRFVIQAGTYPHQDRDINTIATPTILAVRAEVDADAVYQITKTIFENLEYLQMMYKTFTETSLDSALASLPVPLHPGASRYYREVELAIPADLISEKYLESFRDRKQP